MRFRDRRSFVRSAGSLSRACSPSASPGRLPHTPERSTREATPHDYREFHLSTSIARPSETNRHRDSPGSDARLKTSFPFSVLACPRFWPARGRVVKSHPPNNSQQCRAPSRCCRAKHQRYGESHLAQRCNGVACGAANARQHIVAEIAPARRRLSIEAEMFVLGPALHTVLLCAPGPIN